MDHISSRIGRALSLPRPKEPGMPWWGRACVGIGALGTLLIASQIRDIRRYLRMRSL